MSFEQILCARGNKFSILVDLWVGKGAQLGILLGLVNPSAKRVQLNADIIRSMLKLATLFQQIVLPYLKASIESKRPAYFPIKSPEGALTFFFLEGFLLLFSASTKFKSMLVYIKLYSTHIL